MEHDDAVHAAAFFGARTLAYQQRVSVRMGVSTTGGADWEQR
jgi:6,7-dimethyl-8-ribityllumazine synthase